MKNSTALAIVGGIAVGTVAVGVASLVVWSVVPMTIWTLTATVIGTQTMNVLRIKSGQLQPTQVVRPESTHVIPIRQKA